MNIFSVHNIIELSKNKGKKGERELAWEEVEKIFFFLFFKLVHCPISLSLKYILSTLLSMEKTTFHFDQKQKKTLSWVTTF